VSYSFSFGLLKPILGLGFCGGFASFKGINKQSQTLDFLRSDNRSGSTQ
jgi:hypothetical protein